MLREIGGNDVEALRKAAIAEVNRTAGWVRSQYITTVEGQAETYREKINDARAYLASPLPDINNHGWVLRRARARNLSHQEAAETIVATYNQWSALGQDIEEAREAAVEALTPENAPNATDIARERIAGKQALLAFMPAE